MHGMVPNDPQSDVSDYHYAVIYAPRTSRKRFPATCVTCIESKEQAFEQEDHKKKRYAAIVHGPSKSSEGQYIYYLREWLSI